MDNSPLYEQAALLVSRTFDSYLSEFLIITRRAKRIFEQRDWKGGRRNAVERLSLYEKVLSQLSVQMTGLLHNEAFARSTWSKIKPHYAAHRAGQCNEDIAETFFNSATRKLLHTVGIDREVEFFYLQGNARAEIQSPSTMKVYGRQGDTKELLRTIVEDRRFDAPFEDLGRDLEFAANEVDLFLWPIVRKNERYAFEVLTPCFYRNKAAYIVGRIVLEARTIPLAIPLYNDESGIHIDSVLMEEPDVDNIFGFAYSYFHVEAEAPGELVQFLHSILPRKPVPELYTAIGFHKHGKTEFYRDLHRFVHVSKKQFVIAPGREGAVMIVFTLPGYDYVFKVIKDRPCFLRSSHTTDKTISRMEVMARYRFVSHRDRVGRLVDTQEFENVRFKSKRYSEDLLNEFDSAARELVGSEDGYIVVNHLYLQRKVVPLPMYFEKEEDPAAIRQVVIDFGYFLKDLAATGLFPADLFNTWNYGVTEGKRVVLFDYDDVVPLERVKFTRKPEPRDEYEEMNPEEDWVVAEPTDYFVEEMHRFVGVPGPLRGIFNSVHKDLFTIEFWENIKTRVLNGEIIDIIPYDRNKRFRRLSRET